MLNASVKSFCSRGRILVPTELTDSFTKDKKVSIIKTSDDFITLTQNPTRSQKKNIIHQFMPVEESKEIRFCAKNYFEKNTEYVLMFKNEKNNINIYALA